MSWHPVYVDQVLAPDYRFADENLLPHLRDALIAHVMTVAALPRVAGDAEAAAATDALLTTLRSSHGRRLPPRADDVPDAYFAINRELEAALGADTVSFLRTGLSRNDLDMTIYKLAARERLLILLNQLQRLRSALISKASAHLDTVMIAHTHHQPGQPTSVAHYLAGVGAMLERDAERLEGALHRLNTCPLGAAALAGSSHPLDRHLTASLLGFAKPVANTYDAVSSSDWQIEIANAAAGLALNLSRFTCDLLAWSAGGTYRLSDSLVQGSSIMPQKRNPVSLEHARTRFSRAVGSTGQVLYSSHNIPFGDLNDVGPDIQGALRQQHVQLHGGIELLIACLDDGDFVREALSRQARATDTTATELADELVRHHGVAFQEAHALVARAVASARTRGVALQDLTGEDLKDMGGPALDQAELSDALSPAAFIARRAGHGGPAPAVMAVHLKDAGRKLEALEARLAEFEAGLRTARDILCAHKEERE